MIILKDASISEITMFLEQAEQIGKSIATVINPLEATDEKHTVAYEARLLKRMFLKLRG